MIPSPNRFMYILGAIVFLVVAIALISVPWGEMFSVSGSIGSPQEIPVEIGLPWNFIEFDLGDPTQGKFLIMNFILDLLIYLFITYLIDVTINVIMGAFFKSEIQKKAETGLYKVEDKKKK
jgi:hypothetical protein